MRFRPCIDLRAGRVVQIVGSSLKKNEHAQEVVTNFETEQSPAVYAQMYKADNLAGGHVISLGPGNRPAALAALKAFPGGMQLGGGITPHNAKKYLRAGASHVIVTSYVFRTGQVDIERLKKLISVVGKERLVLDLSCRKRGHDFWVVTDRWQRFTNVAIRQDTLAWLADYCAEFLVHGVDVEGKRLGIESTLVEMLGEWSPIPVTYAGGARALADLDAVKTLGKGRVDLTIGSALDIFGGVVPYREVVAWQRRQEKEMLGTAKFNRNEGQKMYNQKYHQFNTFYNHKFGFHICGPRQDAFDAVFRVKPKIVKTLDFSVDVMKRIRQEIPDVFLIGRLFVSPQDYGQLSGGKPQHARQAGLEMADRILREEVNRDIHHINGQPVFHAWESLNEVFPEGVDPDQHKLYDDYQVAFGEKMQAEGFEPIAFNFGQGNGRGKQWLKLYPGTLETYKYLGFHEYDWPTMDRLHVIGLEGPDEPQNLVPVVGEGQGNDGMWRALRYRRIMYEGIRQQYGDKHVCIITECGMTQGVWGGEDIGPWAKELTVPATIPGGVVSTPIPADDYWKSLLWYNGELMKDDYVMGACLFVTGAAGLARWDTFEHLGPIMARLEAFQETSSTAVTPPPSAPVTPARPIEISARAATAAMPPLWGEFQPPTPESPTTDAGPTVGGGMSAATQLPPQKTEPAAAQVAPAWQVKIERGPGLSLLVGDIGLANERLTIVKPTGQTVQLVSGSKTEYGRGGFEVYAQEQGVYKVQFLDQSFDIEMSGQFTRVTFTKLTS